MTLSASYIWLAWLKVLNILGSVFSSAEKGYGQADDWAVGRFVLGTHLGTTSVTSVLLGSELVVSQSGSWSRLPRHLSLGTFSVYTKYWQFCLDFTAVRESEEMLNGC